MRIFWRVFPLVSKTRPTQNSPTKSTTCCDSVPCRCAYWVVVACLNERVLGTDCWLKFPNVFYIVTTAGLSVLWSSSFWHFVVALSLKFLLFLGSQVYVMFWNVTYVSDLKSLASCTIGAVTCHPLGRSVVYWTFFVGEMSKSLLKLSSGQVPILVVGTADGSIRLRIILRSSARSNADANIWIMKNRQHYGYRLSNLVGKIVFQTQVSSHFNCTRLVCFALCGLCWCVSRFH